QIPYTQLKRVARAGRGWAMRWLTFRVREGEPLSRKFGMDRGTPLDRHWLAQFFSRHASPGIGGTGLEVGGTEYLQTYFPRLSRQYLFPTSDGQPACLGCNLETGEGVTPGRFDLLIATQVYNFIHDTREALRHSAELLKPGGVLIGSVGGISQISRYDADRWGHYHSFTIQSWQRYLAEHFDDVQIECFGNVHTACAYLNGLAAEEIDPAILDRHDPDYPVTLCFRAVRR
ncbi:MAG: methyltransferase domain-containing protein, partial [Rubrivivax sp.]